MQLFFIIAVIIMIVFGLITFQNPDVTVTMKFITWTFQEKPISLILAIPLGIGFLAGTFIYVPPWLKKASLARHQKKRIHELETGLAELAESADTEETEFESGTVKEEVREEIS